MKNYILFFSFLFLVNSVVAEINVKSFRKLENDLSARIEAPRKDRNGDLCALVKVVTTQKGFVWEPDGLGITAVDEKTGEFWLYLPWGAKYLTIKHPQLGVLRQYAYPMAIEKATVYEMVLTTGTVTTIVEETIESQWLVITPQPAEALVYINDEFVKTGEYQAKLKPGVYNYRVEAPLYHVQAGRIELGSERVTLPVVLKPAHGFLRFTTLPEKGAQVMLDGKMLPTLTPFTTEPIASGEHTVQVLKEMYQPWVQKITVADGQTTAVTATLSPNFAELSLTAPAAATLFVNNQQRGQGSWKGRLSAGVYSVEAQLDKHRTAKQDIELNAGDKREINLQPSPIYGSLDVVTTPSGATVTINGTGYGTTPTTLNRLLIGTYTVELTKPGYATVKKEVSISEGKSALLSETMVNGRQVTITSTPSGVNLLIDGTPVGTTPYSGHLTFGNHTLKIESGGKIAERKVEVTQTGGETRFELGFSSNFTESIKGISFEMIAIKGGQFQMGSENGDSDERPVHPVVVSDFYMGKTEVTQALWQAVMGNNPSYFKGNNLPVETVSWDDCNQFVEELSRLTGKKYRLPSEAEWEYAAGGGAGNRTRWAGTNSETNLGTYAWYGSNSSSNTLEAGTKQPNQLGLYDMSGNVWEWCGDWYGSYSNSPQTNPVGPTGGSNRVNRGGSWSSNASDCRVSYRSNPDPDYRSRIIGFRLVCLP